MYDGAITASTWTNVTMMRAISSFRSVLITVTNANGVFFNPLTIAVPLLELLNTNDKFLTIRFTPSSGTYLELNVIYINDTSLRLYMNNSNYRIKIIGIK